MVDATEAYIDAHLIDFSRRRKPDCWVTYFTPTEALSYYLYPEATRMRLLASEALFRARAPDPPTPNTRLRIYLKPGAK